MRFIFILFLILRTPFKSQSQETSTSFKKKLYKNKVLKPILKKAQNYGIQIVYTPIDGNKKGETLYYNYNPEQYFYPASTVKLPAVLLALEKLKAIEISKDADYSSHSNLENYTSVHQESFSSYIKKILLVSDNDAFNRLHDFLGQDYFNQKMAVKGYINTKISHRLSIPLSPLENAYTPEISLRNNYIQPAQYAKKTFLETEPILIGKAYYKGQDLINEPMNFVNKNKFDLQDQHNMLLSLFYPDSPSPTFDLRAEDLLFVKDYMSRMPRNAWYEESSYPDNTGKFFLFGDLKGRIPEDIKIYNKIGGACGFLIDNAFIEDNENNIKFFLSAVIYTNANDILNDDLYEYNSIGLPFLGELGRYMYQLNKKN